ncbi:alpha/beta hydrolase family protein [Deinococcus pimensis]|uniref:alpha/beta hydrolase family protein n=1 Tax=Deinococcus pimensis TaxID=309888 RepID=UPI00048302AD|nr:alpha/beta hydrolase [Deinococcus pimensis]
MRRAALLVLAALAASAGATRSEDVTLTTRDATLRGTLLLPDGQGPFPVALLVVGSGPEDRDGNSPLLPAKLGYFRALAEALAARGIATLRYDKIGAGTGVAAATKFATANDGRGLFRAEIASIGGWTQKLRADPRLGEITVVGHSQGALMALLAARTVQPDRVVSLAGQGADIGTTLERQLSAQLPPALLADVRGVLSTIRATGRAPALPASLAAVPVLSALFQGVNGAYLADWIRFDPATQAERLTAPLLVVGGGADAQVTPDEVRRVAGARGGIQLAFVDGMSHVLKQATPEPASQAAAYSNPEVPLAPGLADTLAAFIRSGR